MPIADRQAPKRETYKVLHQKELKLEDLGSFLYHPGFWDEFREYGLEDDDLRELEVMLIMIGGGADEIRGSNGIRFIVVTPEALKGRRRKRLAVLFYRLESRGITYVIKVVSGVSKLRRMTREDATRLADLAREIEREEGAGD
jgi:hypothetical protein